MSGGWPSLHGGFSRRNSTRTSKSDSLLVLAMASPMKSLAAQRCYNHAQREAAARCTECRHFFCRECVSEHDDRVLCAACLRKLLRKSPARRRSFTGAVQFLQCALGVLAAWFFFYLAGEVLLSIPTSFHEGTLWQTGWFESE